MLADLSFDETIAGLRGGDNVAITRLADWCAPRIRILIDREIRRLHLGRFTDWEDIWQDVFTLLCAGAGHGQFVLDSPLAVLGLLIVMSKHRAADLARHHRTEDRAVDHSSAADGLLRSSAGHGRSPARMVDCNDFLEWALPQLRECARESAMRRASGQDWNQIADATGRSPEALRKALERALAVLRPTLGLPDAGLFDPDE